MAGSVTDEAHVREVVAQATRTFGKLHIVVNNAGSAISGKRLHEIDDATWANVLDINLTGVFRMTRAAIPELIKNGGGSIVNISTVASLVGLRGLSAYAASKGGLDALTRSLAVDYAQDNIRCNSVNPGWSTRRWPRPNGGPCQFGTYHGAVCHPAARQAGGNRQDGAVPGFR